MSLKSGQTVSAPFSSRRDRNYNSLRTTKRNKIPIFKGIGDGPGQKGSEPGMIGEIMLDRTNGKFCWHSGFLSFSRRPKRLACRTRLLQGPL